MTSLRQLQLSILSALFVWIQPLSAQNWAAQSTPYGRPDATIDLRTREGTQLVAGTWRYSDVKIMEVDSKGPGPDLKPSGAPIRSTTRSAGAIRTRVTYLCSSRAGSQR